jgi:hypothetical protein
MSNKVVKMNANDVWKDRLETLEVGLEVTKARITHTETVADLRRELEELKALSAKMELQRLQTLQAKERAAEDAIARLELREISATRSTLLKCISFGVCAGWAAVVVLYSCAQIL